MRTRTQTIFSTDESDFHAQIEESLQLRNSRRKRFNTTQQSFLRSSFANLYNSDDEDSDDNLSAFSNYKIELKPLSLKEKEIQEEQELESFIHTLNKTSSTSTSSDDDINISPNIEMKANFITQNVKSFHHNIKLLIIGNKESGKSLFVKKMLGDMNQTYYSSNGLNINKTVLELQKEKIVQVELFDTTVNMINNGMINTYYMIASGFVIVVRKSQIKEDLIIAKKQIENIRKVKKDKARIVIIVNEDCEYEGYENEVESIIEEGDIEYVGVNLKRESDIRRNEKLICFLKRIGESKEKGINN